MKLYQEKLDAYKRAEEEIKKQIEEKKAQIEKQNKEISELEQTLNTEKEKLTEYVKQEIILRNYKIGKKELEDGKIIYYPILEMPGGFKQIEHEVSYFEKYDVDYEVFYDEIQYKCILENEMTGLKISVFADSSAYRLGYNNKNICFCIKENFAMDYCVNYKVKINGKEFKLERLFEGKIIEQVLEEMLKDKYVCYNDFDTESQKKSLKRKVEHIRSHLSSKEKYRNWHFRECINYMMHSDLKGLKGIEDFLKGNAKTGDIEKIILDIKEQVKKDIPVNKKAYPLGKKYSLIVILYNRNADNRCCIAYEDEQLILEIPLPIKYIGLNLGIINKPYDKNWEYTFEDGCVIDTEQFAISVNELDMNKKIPILDIIRKFKN